MGRKEEKIFNKSRRDEISIYLAEANSLSFVFYNEEVISTFSLNGSTRLPILSVRNL
jgi:hypothetical protein